MKTKQAFLLLFSCWLPLSFCLAQAPTWSVNAANFEHSMSVVAQVKFEGAQVNSGNNIVGAFVGSELRGVASPINVGGQHYYFLSVYSNVFSGETVDFQIWLDSETDTFPAVESIPFVRGSSVGNYPNGLELNVSLLNDFEIQLTSFPADTTLAGIPFDSVLLTNNLVTIDHDSVVWSVISGSNLTGSISSTNYLNVTPNNSTWTGTDSVLVIGTEFGTVNAFADSQYVSFTVLDNYLGPEFTYIPVQFSDSTYAFPADSLGRYLAFEGDSLSYEYQFVPPNGTEPNPNWTPPGAAANSMVLTIRVLYGEKPYEGAGELAGFVGGNLAGTINATTIGQELYYFLTLADLGSGNIDFQFYDTNRSTLHTVQSEIAFLGATSQGSFNNPIELNLSPFTLDITHQGNWSVHLIDSTWAGEMKVQICATDADYPSKKDSLTVVFTKNVCSIEEMEICPTTDTCLIAESTLTDVVWFKDGLPIAQSMEYSVVTLGDYHYEGRDTTGCLAVSCPIIVTQGTGCSGSFSSVSYPPIILNLPPACDSLTYEDYTTKTSCCTVSLYPKAFLQGPFDSTLVLMNDDLRIANLIPLTEPYTELSNFSHLGIGGGEIIDSTILQVSGNDAIVDWVFLELRDKTDSLNVWSSQSALIQRDGDVVGLDGSSAVAFEYQCPDDYYLTIRHRNHLGVMSATPLTLTETPSIIDFTASATNTFGSTNGIAQIGAGYFGLFSGDFNINGQIQNTDIQNLIPNIGLAGYRIGDLNLNGQVQNTDLQSSLRPNLGRGAQFNY